MSSEPLDMYGITQPESDSGGEGDWPEVWLQRPTPVADAENYSVWGSAENDAVPYELDDTFRHYIPAPDQRSQP